MEPRTLLAMLQLSGGLGEQSTLDSVSVRERDVFLNMPKSKNDPHSDGTAIAYVTLTTANSSSGNPGVALDILLRAAWHARYRQRRHQRGLADTDGQIGADVPVTIIPTTPDEQPGDRVIVQFNFLYNPTTFASAMPPVFLSGLLHLQREYDRSGVEDHQAGGNGITPVGPGTSDHISGTLNARIGDTFTLSFSESLAGHTIAPYLGAGIDDVGWESIPTSIRRVSPARDDFTTVSTLPAGQAEFGRNVAFTATVADTSNSPDAETPIGTVQFTVDGKWFRAPVDLDGGTATITDANLPVGSHAISAMYTPGTHNFQASSPLAPTPLVIQADSS